MDMKPIKHLKQAICTKGLKQNLSGTKVLKKSNKGDQKKKSRKNSTTVSNNRLTMKRGLFQKGLCSSPFNRDTNQAETFARLKGDLNKVIGFVNGKLPAQKMHFSPSSNRRVQDKAGHNDFSCGVSPSLQPSPQTKSPFNVEASSTKISGNSPHSSLKENNLNTLNLENIETMSEVKKKRTAEFVDGLSPTPSDRSILKNCSQSPVKTNDELIKAGCYNEHVSVINSRLLEIKEKRFPHSDYNLSLKKKLTERFKSRLGSLSLGDESIKKNDIYSSPLQQNFTPFSKDECILPPFVSPMKSSIPNVTSTSPPGSIAQHSFDPLSFVPSPPQMHSYRPLSQVTSSVDVADKQQSHLGLFFKFRDNEQSNSQRLLSKNSQEPLFVDSQRPVNVNSPFNQMHHHEPYHYDLINPHEPLILNRAPNPHETDPEAPNGKNVTSAEDGPTNFKFYPRMMF